MIMIVMASIDGVYKIVCKLMKPISIQTLHLKLIQICDIASITWENAESLEWPIS